MSKMIKIYPLRTKTAAEVAQKFWLYISQFGPTEEILSDCGTEFLNETVSALLNVAGIERRVTSPYMPRVDGLCERANQTVANVLKKHAEADNHHWDDWLPFVEYSYNTRINSTTKFSPFEIVFGREPNDFKNFSSDKGKSEEKSLSIRSKEIKQA